MVGSSVVGSAVVTLPTCLAACVFRIEKMVGSSVVGSAVVGSSAAYLSVAPLSGTVTGATAATTGVVAAVARVVVALDAVVVLVVDVVMVAVVVVVAGPLQRGMPHSNPPTGSPFHSTL